MRYETEGQSSDFCPKCRAIFLKSNVFFYEIGFNLPTVLDTYSSHSAFGCFQLHRVLHSTSKVLNFMLIKMACENLKKNSMNKILKVRTQILFLLYLGDLSIKFITNHSKCTPFQDPCRHPSPSCQVPNIRIAVPGQKSHWLHSADDHVAIRLFAIFHRQSYIFQFPNI